MSLSVCGFYAYVIKGYWFCMEMYVLVLIRGIYCALTSHNITTPQNSYIYFHIKPITYNYLNKSSILQCIGLYLPLIASYSC